MYFEVYDVMKHVVNISLIRNDVKNKNGINSEGKHAPICMNCQNYMILQKIRPSICRYEDVML